MIRQIPNKTVGGLLILAILLGITACGGELPQVSSEKSADGTAGNIFMSEDTENEPVTMSITVSLPSSDLTMRQNNEKNDRLVEAINECTGMDIQWIWYDSEVYDAQIEKDIIAGEVADVILAERSEIFLMRQKRGFSGI